MTTPIYDELRIGMAARMSDPATSHAAVPPLSKVWQVQQRVLSILTDHGPLTHDHIRRHYIARHGMGPGSSAASVRTRTSELHDLGGVRAVDREGRTPSGRSATRWDVHREDQ